MSTLLSALAKYNDVRLVTLTTDPDFDQPEVLRQYSERFDANQDRWWFLTGTKPQIARLAVGGLKLAAIEIPPADRLTDTDLFIHSTVFVVVDKQGRLRAAVETQADDDTEEGVANQVKKTAEKWETQSRPFLLKVIEQLRRE